MKKFQFILLFLILLFNWALICQPLSGDKIIGSVGDYPSLSIAITELNNHGISGTLRFLIDENLLESGTGLVINRADLTNVNNLIIKPNIGKSPTITITNFALFGSVEQAFTINNSSFITIDGSNTEDGLTRDLTIIGNDNTASQAYLIGVINNSDNITIKNLKLKKNNMPSNSSGITLDGEITPGTGAPSNYLIKNCEIGEESKAFRNGIAAWGNTTATPTIGVILDNDIYASRRGITTFYIRWSVFKHNTISIVSADADQAFYAGIYLTGSLFPDSSIIEGNRIIKLTMNTNSSPKFGGGIVIYGNAGTLSIINNFIAPIYENLGTNNNNNIYGIVFGSATWVGTAHIYHNTIVIPQSSATGRHACIGWEVNSNARLNVRNNILVNNHNSSSSYVIHYPMPITSSSVLNSDYNNLFVSGSNSLIAFYNSLNCSSLNNWQSATTRDLNSKSKIVYFISANDLHLINSSIGDIELMAEPVSWVYTDIDDEFRNLLFPYKGADERPEAPLPVELINFSAILIDEKVKLRWQTVTEVNSYGFEVERKIIDQQDWEMIGFVPGSGNSNSPKNYKLVDEVPNKRTSYLYRLKQIDTNGGFKYSNIIEVEWRIQINFALEQNYPNPFNPSTSIQYSVASTEHVTLKIYDILGNEVATLVNEEKEPGIYRTDFNTQNYQLASGIYLYRIQSGKFVETKKMILMK